MIFQQLNRQFFIKQILENQRENTIFQKKRTTMFEKEVNI